MADRTRPGNPPPAAAPTAPARSTHNQLAARTCTVSEHLVAEPVGLAGIGSLPGPAKAKRLRGIATSL